MAKVLENTQRDLNIAQSMKQQFCAINLALTQKSN